MDRVWQGAALRQLRMLARKSIADVAVRLGVNQSTVSQWELGISNPRRDHIEGLADFYEMPLELLLYEIGYELSNPPSLRQWYRARNGTIPTSASGSTPPSAVDSAALEGAKRHLPHGNANLDRTPMLAAAS